SERAKFIATRIDNLSANRSIVALPSRTYPVHHAERRHVPATRAPASARRHLSMIRNLQRMRIAVGAGVLLAAALIAAVAFGAFAAPTSATAPDQITIASAADGNNVPVGNDFTVTMAVTASTSPYKSIQWEIAYPPNVSFVSPATYTCSQFPSETETQPAEDNSGTLIGGLPGMTVLGGGSNCASLSGTFNGTTALGVFVTVTLHCGANGAVPVIAVNANPGAPAGDQLFGTT